MYYYVYKYKKIGKIEKFTKIDLIFYIIQYILLCFFKLLKDVDATAEST